MCVGSISNFFFCAKQCVLALTALWLRSLLIMAKLKNLSTTAYLLIQIYVFFPCMVKGVELETGIQLRVYVSDEDRRISIFGCTLYRIFLENS